MHLFSKKTCRILLSLTVLIIILLLKEVRTEENSIEIAKFYGGYSAAVILRVDDFIVDERFEHYLPNDLKNPTEWFENYELQFINYLKKYPRIKVAFGIITYCSNETNCRKFWRIYNDLIDKGWEACTHTTYHTFPRSEGDIVSSILSINKHLNYTVTTYIVPFGKMEKIEEKWAKEANITIIMKTLPPLQITVPKNWLNVHATIKMAQNLPWFLLLKIFLPIAEKIHGVVIVYTHATSFDWDSSKTLLENLERLVNFLENKDVWITTPRELYEYEVLRNSVKIIRINETTYKLTLDKSINATIPLTLLFQISKTGNIKGVYKNNHLLEKLSAVSSDCYKEGYFIKNNKLVIIVKVPCTLRIDLAKDVA